MSGIQDGIILDLSEFQLNIDFARLSKVPNLKGVIIRVQAGFTHLDSKYKEYVAGCKQYGIPFSTYAYFRGVSVPDSIAEAKSAYANMDKDSIAFAVDIESVSMTDLVAGGQAFVDYLKAQGLPKVGVYSGKYFYDAHGLANIRCDFQWLAAYGNNDGQPHTAPNDGDELWQFTSVGHVDGISTNVDENIVTGGTMEYFTGRSNLVVAAPSAPTAPSPANPNSIEPQFCTKQTILQTLRCDGHTDIRVAPNHMAAYVRDTQPREVFHVFDKVKDAQGHTWNNVGGANWVDEASGVFYWLDNPNLRNPAPQAPQQQYHTVVPGDTVSGLAAQFGSTQAQIKAWNNLANVNLIRLGQRLRVK